MKKRIGILGGTFNPIHTGHLILAENAYDALKLDSVLIMPTGVSYLKDGKEIVSKQDRYNMCKLAIYGNRHLKVSDYELIKEGNTYTYETLTELKEAHPNNEYYFIMGADSLMSIETWMKPEIIFEKALLVVYPRDLNGVDELNDRALELKNKYDARIEVIDAPNMDISSHMLRDRILNGRTVKYYLPARVEKYIYEHGLYIEART